MIGVETSFVVALLLYYLLLVYIKYIKSIIFGS